MARLIDSSALIALERRGMTPDEVQRLLPDDDASIAAITASELLTGVHRAAPTERRLRRQAFVETVLDVVPVLPFDLTVARIHALVGSQLAEIGQRVDTHDLLIAATALAHGLPVCTENLRDFERIPGLDVIRPEW
jgi:tRNA(fMet)-specific endonuclease VapC